MLIFVAFVEYISSSTAKQMEENGGGGGDSGGDHLEELDYGEADAEADVDAEDRDPKDEVQISIFLSVLQFAVYVPLTS
ncbi:hypothetical protein KIN20_027570 [Parelaphostrongylus tenuis]|uniref:Uncharacterized protein n=1 Tax=Parelaphostrongylus tenuis TaxID=148309 RepID=A0AAD5QZK7_PARTN|nr:hypothetical protein KIN20_027570 [Parelaphostrongylus tenuis]